MDLMDADTSVLAADQLRIYVAALRGVVRLTRLELARKEREVCTALLNSVSYRSTLADRKLAEAEADNVGAAR